MPSIEILEPQEIQVLFATKNMIWLILLSVITTLLWYVFVKSRNYFSNLGIKEIKSWPVFGESWKLIFGRTSLCEFVEYIYNMYPNSRVTGFYQFLSPTLMIRDPELVKQIAVKDFDHFTDHRSFLDPEADELWGKNLFSLKGQKWREMRATLSGSFTSSKMKSLFHVMNDVTSDFVNYFINQNKDVIEVEMKSIFTRYTNDIIATSAFGIKVDTLANPENDFYTMGTQLTNLNGLSKKLKFLGYFISPLLCRIFKISIFDKDVSKYFKTIIDDTIESREKNGIVRPDMINLLLEARKGVKDEEKEVFETGFATVKESDIGKHFKQHRYISNDDITAQGLIFFFAGFDTVSTAISFGTYELALNRDIQDKLRNEIKATHKETNGKLTYDALMKMKYLDMVVSETLRKWAPVVQLDRIVTKPYTIEPANPGEKPIPLKINDLIWIPVHAIHRDPEYYPNPDKFDPERFSDENKDTIRPYTYMPFGLGPRNCIGSRFALLEIKSLLFKLLLNFEIVRSKITQVPIKLSRTTIIGPAAADGFWLELRRVKN